MLVRVTIRIYRACADRFCSATSRVHPGTLRSRVRLTTHVLLAPPQHTRVPCIPAFYGVLYLRSRDIPGLDAFTVLVCLSSHALAPRSAGIRLASSPLATLLC